MSDLHRDGQVSQGVQEIVDRASIWLERREEGDWTDADQKELDAWLAQSLGHRIEYWRIEAAWRRADRLGALRPQQRSAAGSRFWPLLIGAAAVFGGALVFAAWGQGSFASDQRTYRTAVGGHEVIALPDGSRIELNTDTVLHTDIGAGHRTAVLEKGEAYFTIRHDAGRPFVVTAVGHRVIDLGTRFLVRNKGAELEVALFEGRAKFESTGAWAQQHSAVLTPGDTVVATATSMSETRIPPKELLGNLGWRMGVIVFHRTTLADAAAEFNRYNTRKLVIGEGSVGGLVVGGTFPIHDVEAFTRVAQQVFGLKIEKRSTEISISR